MAAFEYLLRFAFDALVTVLVLRVWLQAVQADFYNPLCQFIVKVTNPMVIPFRRIIPGFGGIDVATVLIAYVAAAVKFLLISMMNGGELNVLTIALIGFIFLIKHVGFLLMIIMLVMALMSWVVQGYNPTIMIFQQLTEPFLRPIRKVVPVIGGLDLSILVAFLILNFFNILLSGWIPYWAWL